MERKCPQYRTRMYRTGKETTLERGCILVHKGDGFLYKDTSCDLTAYYYVCHNCGLVQQYIPDDLLEYLKHLNNFE